MVPMALGRMQAGVTASPEGLVNGGDRGGDRGLDPSQLSPRDAGTVEVSDLSSPKPLTFDLLNMVVSFKRMVIFLEPVNDVMELVKFLLGWRMPLCSLFCCVVLNVLFLTLSEVAWFSLCLLGISTPAALGYFRECRRGSASETALRRKQYHAVQRRDLQTVRMSRQEALLEVKGLLKLLDDILTQTCLSAESVYKVLYWESHIASSIFYGSLLVLLCLLYAAPMGWTLVVVNSALFLWNRDFRRVILEKRDLLQQGCLKPTEEAESPEPEQPGLGDRTPTPNSMEDFSPGSVEEAEEAEPDDDFKDAIEESPASLPEAPLVALVEDDDVPAGAPEYDSTSDNGLLSRNEPIRSKVSKLTERLRKLNSGANNAGNCSSCNAVFSVLKKRRNCSSCGNSFCSRCCSFKVLKSTMGATAPEALKESVFVCGPCNSILTKD